MLKRQFINPLRNITNFLQSDNVLLQQSRNTFILKRRYPPGLTKKNQRPHPLKGRHYVYDLVECTEIKPMMDLEVILTKYVEGIGTPGQVLTLKAQTAYNKLLLPKLAVYASPENKEKYKHLIENVDDNKVEHSSPFVQRTVDTIQRHVFSVIMNKETPWVIEPWHVKMALRKGGIECPLEAITMPKEEIKGPDMSLENKQFTVTIMINNLETAKAKCRIHHWSTTPSERLPYLFEYWKVPAEGLVENETN